MQRAARRLAPLLLLVAGATVGIVHGTSSTPTASAAVAGHTAAAGEAHGFERFLRRYESANTAFQNGDPSAWLRITAQRDPVSIFGGFGGLGEAGTASVHQRYLLAATAFQPSGAEVDFHYLVKHVQHRLAYTVAIERSNVLYAGQTERRPQILRVTMLFRRDHGDWKIVHRHADTMVDLQLPTGGDAVRTAR